jgi:hypothetical protein
MAKMSVSIKEIIIGQATGQTDRVEPHTEGVSIIPVASPALWAQTSLELLSQPNIRSTGEAVPFVRIIAEDERLSIAIADDLVARVRILEESLDNRIPLIVDAYLDDETDVPKRDVMVTKIARAFGVLQPELLRIALTQTKAPDGNTGTSNQERQFLGAHQHAIGLAQQVRKIDDQMTASVVPDWLFVACGVGALFVMLTAIALFYPELRTIIIPSMIVFGGAGLCIYAWRSWQELKIRASLQENRRQLRQEREQARSEAKTLADALSANGIDPDTIVLNASESLQSPSNPIILCRDSIDPVELELLQASKRQVLVFTLDDEAAGSCDVALIRKAEPVSTPS